MNILLVSNMYYPDIKGGAETSTKILAEELVKKGHNVDVLTLGNEENIENICGVNIYRKNLQPMNMYLLSEDNKSKVLKLKKLFYRISDMFFNKKLSNIFEDFINGRNYDLIHTVNNMYFLNKYTFWRIAKNNKLKVFHTIHDPSLICMRVDMDNKSSFLDYIWRCKYKKHVKYVDCCLSPSQYILDLHKKYGYNFIKNTIIFNPVVTDMKVGKFEDKDNTIIYAGTISEYKGVMTLVKSFQKINDEQELIKLKLFGEGSIKQKIKEITINQSIEVNDFLSQEKLYEEISKVKVVVLPSEWEEAFGMILVEAVYNGTLIIGSDRGAIPEVMNKFEQFIFKAGDVDDLKSKIEYVMSLNKEEYEKIINSMQNEFKKYSSYNYVNRVENAYKENL